MLDEREVSGFVMRAGEKEKEYLGRTPSQFSMKET